MKQQKTLLTVALLASVIVTSTAQASLVARDGGMVYDDVNNLTWTSDANLFQTQAASNPNLVNDIIAANGGVVYDTPHYYASSGPGWIYDDGTYNLTSADFNTSNSTMTWFGAQAWTNSLTLGGYTDWRLPSVSYYGGGTRMSEMGAFFNQLGGVAGNSITTTHNTNYDLFSNILPEQYWSYEEYSGNANSSWFFFTAYGVEGVSYKTDKLFAWAVRPGDVAAVPLPAAVWLFGSGLIGLASVTRRKNKSANLIAA